MAPTPQKVTALRRNLMLTDERDIPRTEPSHGLNFRNESNALLITPDRREVSALTAQKSYAQAKYKLMTHMLEILWTHMHFISMMNADNRA
jgi:hypothetical protein